MVNEALFAVVCTVEVTGILVSCYIEGDSCCSVSFESCVNCVYNLLEFCKRSIVSGKVAYGSISIVAAQVLAVCAVSIEARVRVSCDCSVENLSEPWSAFSPAELLDENAARPTPGLQLTVL